MATGKYKVTVWNLSGPNDDVESKREFYCDITRDYVDLVHWIIHGIKGHYRLRVEDMELDFLIYESQLTYKSGV